jgi:hypothetical protein
MWRPISLLFKNQLTDESPFFVRATHTHGLLRVIESVRAAEGDEPIGRLYTAIGSHLHNSGESSVDPKVALAEAGLSTKHAEAMNDETWDDIIRKSMADGLSLTGQDVGTPILAFTNGAGRRVGFFGPVISRRLPLDQSLQLWDGLMLMAGVDSFWELKRTRTESPDFTELS